MKKMILVITDDGEKISIAGNNTGVRSPQDPVYIVYSEAVRAAKKKLTAHLLKQRCYNYVDMEVPA
jgi:hypothetical protein